MTVTEALLVEDDPENYRRELVGYCYRMLGSGSEAEDATQETMLRAWRHADGFEGRSSMRSWLYRIATNVCIDMQRQVQRRARPMDFGPASPPDESFLGPMQHEVPWITPLSDAAGAPGHGADPADIAQYRESVRLAFIAALQQLPARQRAVLILCEVLRWSASDVAGLLDTSVASVNSALQRARATLQEHRDTVRTRPLTDADAELLERYVAAFESYDIDTLVTLLHVDATQQMPPFAMWLQGAIAIGEWMVQPGPMACKGSRLVPISANGCKGFAQYRRDPSGGYAPWAIQVLEVTNGVITAMHSFLAALEDEDVFAMFGLPAHLDD